MEKINKYKSQAISAVIACIAGVLIGTIGDITGKLSGHFRAVNESVKIDSAQNQMIRKHEKVMSKIADKVDRCQMSDTLLLNAINEVKTNVEGVRTEIVKIKSSTNKVEGFLQHWNYSPTAATTAEIEVDNDYLYLLK